MRNINLAAIPNQSLTVQLDNRIWDITIKETKGVMSATVLRDNVLLLSNQRLTPGTPLIPYEYLEDGNFFFITNDGDYPYYTEFGKTQNLIYASEAELNAIRST